MTGHKRITPDQQRKFVARLKDGWTVQQSGEFAGVSASWAYTHARGLKGNGDTKARTLAEALSPPSPIPRDKLGPEALRALDDFGYFRYRYLGRKSTPWQEEAGHKVVEWLATPIKEFVVENCPPGSGKSTLTTLDIPLWLTCRDRSIRGMLGSASQTLANAYLFRISNHFRMTTPVQAEADDLELGLAVDAQATLIGDYGVFYISGSPWSTQKIVVAQLDDRLLTQKEATWTAWGMNSGFIGGRYRVCLWDDAFEEKDLLTEEALTKLRNRWDKQAEKRLEPAGLMLLQGQRLTPDDLYAYCRDKKAGASTGHDHDCCDAEPGAKYHHVIFKAHDETRCEGDHGEDAAYFPQGCLLDPRRLPWRELESEMENGLGNFLQVYQQEDGDPAELLVNPLWVKGGTDPSTGEMFPGCWDPERAECELPRNHGQTISVCSTDPSPSKYWASGWWCVERGEPNRRFLMDLYRQHMRSDDFLDRRDGRFVGLAEEWWQRSRELGMPITHWIFEKNAAQLFFLQTEVARNWSSARGVTWVEHTTSHKRTDPKWGPYRLSSIWRQGLVRLPGAGLSRTMSLKLVDEVQKWPKGRYDDCVQQQLFLELNLEWLLGLSGSGVTRLNRPSWLRRTA